MTSRQRQEGFASAPAPAPCRPGTSSAAPFLVPLVCSLGGCDPILNIQGAFFPAWILCLAGGLVATGIAHRLLIVSGLQPHVGPLPLVYPSIVILATNLLWLLLFRT